MLYYLVVDQAQHPMIAGRRFGKTAQVQPSIVQHGLWLERVEAFLQALSIGSGAFANAARELLIERDEISSSHDRRA